MKTLTQNPAPVSAETQEFKHRVQQQTDEIMRQFVKVLPSNYVSKVTGPFYMLQFQAAAEQLATFQVTAQEVFKDTRYEFTRTEFLWEVLGALVFPDATTIPTVPEGDQHYRDFLRRMVVLLLQGATPATVLEGAELLSAEAFTLMERFLEAQVPGSAFTIRDQFFFDLEREGLPPDALQMRENVRLILEALKPAHTLYGYTHLLREAFGPLFVDTPAVSLTTYHYDDFRRFFAGVAGVSGTTGVSTARTLFSDAARTFDAVQVGGLLHILSGPNTGSYRVTEVLRIPMVDAVARPYITAPSELSGTAVVLAGGIVSDPAQDFGSVVEGEQLTFQSGPNIGAAYRMETLLGLQGGPVGVATGPATQVRMAASMLRLETRMPVVGATGMSYRVDGDRLGMSTSLIRTEDVSLQFRR